MKKFFLVALILTSATSILNALYVAIKPDSGQDFYIQDAFEAFNATFTKEKKFLGIQNWINAGGEKRKFAVGTVTSAYYELNQYFLYSMNKSGFNAFLIDKCWCITTKSAVEKHKDLVLQPLKIEFFSLSNLYADMYVPHPDPSVDLALLHLSSTVNSSLFERNYQTSTNQLDLFAYSAISHRSNTNFSLDKTSVAYLMNPVNNILSLKAQDLPFRNGYKGYNFHLESYPTTPKTPGDEGAAVLLANTDEDDVWLTGLVQSPKGQSITMVPIMPHNDWINNSILKSSLGESVSSTPIIESDLATIASEAYDPDKGGWEAAFVDCDWVFRSLHLENNREAEIVVLSALDLVVKTQRQALATTKKYPLMDMDSKICFISNRA
jgi:hypothetical protein